MAMNHEMAAACVEVRQCGPVVNIRLNRPQVHNALDAATVAALTAALIGLDAKARLIVLQGAGKSFCAGADLREMQQSVHVSSAENRVRAAALGALFAQLDCAPQVVIGKVQGAALGGGAGLLACCDLVVATDAVRIGFTEVRLGLAPALIAPYVLRRIGAAAARRLFVTAEILGAAAAQKVGLLDVVVSPAALDNTVAQWQKQVLGNGPQAIAAIKILLRALANLTSEQGAAACVDTLARLRIGDEGQEGLRAFAARRCPSWCTT